MTTTEAVTRPTGGSGVYLELPRRYLSVQQIVSISHVVCTVVVPRVLSDDFCTHSFSPCSSSSSSLSSSSSSPFTAFSMINVNLPGLFSGGISPTNTSGSTGYFSNTRQADEFLVLVAESFFPTMAVLVRKVLRISRMCGVLTILSTAVGCSALRVSDWTLRKLAEPGWLPPAAFSNKLFCDCVAKYNCYDVRGGSNSSRRGMEESAMWVAKRLCITSDVFAVGGGAENLMEQCPVGVLELLKTRFPMEILQWYYTQKRAGTSGVRVNYMS